MVSSILTREGDTASISCLATDPSLDSLRLEACNERALASGLQFSASLEQGIIIHNVQKAYSGCYMCTGTLLGKYVRSQEFQLIVKPGKMEFLYALLSLDCYYQNPFWALFVLWFCQTQLLMQIHFFPYSTCCSSCN